MDNTPADNGVHRVWLVERYFGGVTPHRLSQLAADTRTTVAELGANGVAVAYLGSTAIPQEETCFCSFVAESPSAIEQVNSHLVVPSLRIVGALSSRRLGP
jgi:hypothetical protein